MNKQEKTGRAVEKQAINKKDRMDRAMERAVKKGARKKRRVETCMILRAVEWPKPWAALKYTVFCGIASAAAGMVIYLYQYGVTEIVGRFL